MNIPEMRAAIARVGMTNRSIAEQLNISEQAFYNKLNGDSEFKGSEIKALAKILHLTMDEVDLIFFGNSVN